MRRWIWSVSCAAMVFLAPHAVAAQSTQDFRQEATLRLGSVYLTPTIALKEFGVDTNVFNSAGEQQSDFFFAVAPQTNVWVPVGRRALITASTAGDAVFFQRFATERSVDPRGQVRGEVFINRVTVFGTGSFLRSRQRPNLEIDVRARRLERSVGAGVNVRILQKLALEVAREQSRVEFDGEALFFGTNLRESLNREGRGTTAALRYQLTPLTSLVVRGEAVDDRFQLSPMRNARSESFAPGVEFKAGALITGSASVGVRRFHAVDERVPDYQGTTAAADLTYTLLGATRLRFTADRDVAYSFEPSEPYYLRSGYGYSVGRPLAGPFDATVSFQRYTLAYRDLAYRDLAGSAAITEGRSDVTRIVAASIDYSVTGRSRFGFSMSYWTRESHHGTRAYESLRVGASATYGF